MTWPSFYDPERVGALYAPDTAEAVTVGLAEHLPPASRVDFIHKDGSLSVPGAIEDTRRTIEWIFSHAAEITHIAASLDSHLPTQIFYATWWVSSEGGHPAPFTLITGEDVDAGRWRPLFETAWSREYVRLLEAQAKKALMIWPYHTMIGTPGHSVTPALYEAIAYHATARQTPPTFLTKGTLPKTEFYSLLEPEVKVAEEPDGGVNRPFLDLLASYDLIYIAGQAKSHCVLETVQSVRNHFRASPEAMGKLRVLIDCTSSVVHPQIDFDAIANETFARFAEEGLRLVHSTDPVG